MQTAINWSDVLQDIAINVRYSTLSIPDDERTGGAGTIAEISLPSDYYIDVSWSDSNEKYAVRLYQEYFRNKKYEGFCDTPEEVVEMVRWFAMTVPAEEISPGFVVGESASQRIPIVDKEWNAGDIEIVFMPEDANALELNGELLNA